MRDLLLRLTVLGLASTSLLVACSGDEPEVGTSTQAATATGRYIVKFKNRALGMAAVTAAGGSLALDLPPQSAAAVNLPAAAVAGLQNSPHIEYVEDDALRAPYAQTTPFGVSMVKAAAVSHQGTGNVKVCIIDSGYNRGHEDLPSDALVVSGDSDPTGTGNWYDDTCGHGTHVAGTMTALDNDLGVVGVATGVKLHIVKVFGGADCSWTYSSTLVAAANKCKAAGAKVISMSLGGTMSSRTEDTTFASL